MPTADIFLKSYQYSFIIRPGRLGISCLNHPKQIIANSLIQHWVSVVFFHLCRPFLAERLLKLPLMLRTRFGFKSRFLIIIPPGSIDFHRCRMVYWSLSVTTTGKFFDKYAKYPAAPTAIDHI